MADVRKGEDGALGLVAQADLRRVHSYGLYSYGLYSYGARLGGTGRSWARRWRTNPA